MNKKVNISIDMMGGENSPDKTIEGVKIFLDKYEKKEDFVLNLFGKEKIIQDKISKYNISSNFINIINSEDVISNEESPLTAIKNSKNTSMWNCIKHQLEGKSDISL